MRKINLKNIIWKEGKYYVSQCLNVDVASFGKTKKEAIVNLNEALKLYFEDNNEDNLVKVENPELINSSFFHA